MLNRLLVVVVSLLLVPISAFSSSIKPVDVDPEFQKEVLFENACFIEKSQFAKANFALPKTPVFLTDTASNLSVTSDTLYLLFSLNNSSKSVQEVLFDIGATHFDYFQLYTISAPGKLEKLFGYEKETKSLDRSIYLIPSAQSYYFLKVFNAHKTSRLNPSIVSKNFYEASRYKKEFVSLVFYGSLLFVFILSASLYFYFKRIYIGWYALYVLCFGFFLINYEGLLDGFLYQTNRGVTHKVSISMICMSYLFNLLFLTRFLKTGKYFKSLFVTSRGFAVALFVIALANIITPVNEFLRHYVMLVAIACILFILVVLIKTYLKKIKEVKLVIFSYCWLMFFGLLTTQVATSDVNNEIDGDLLMKVGLLGEVLMLTLAVLILIFKENDQLRVLLKIELDNSQEKNLLLEEKQEELEELSSIKDKFLVNISHELRTPLNAILGTASIMKSSNISAEAEKSVDVITHAGQHLTHVIDDILSIKILTKDEIVLEKDEFILADKVQELASIYYEKAVFQKIYFDVDTLEQTKSTKYIGDPVKLVKAISVLLDNSLKYTHEGSINMLITTSGIDAEYDELKVQVIDTGIGISESDKSSVFEMFTQQDDDYTRLYGGIGVGLTIFHKIIDKFDGHIIFESSEGEGSEFGFTIKLKKVISKKITDVVSTDQQLNVLLVEDDEVNLFIAKQLLQKLSIPVVVYEATNGQEAIEEVLNNDINFIFMDLQMPIMNGFESAKIIRALDNTSKSKIPIVALTAHTQNTERVKSKQVGMNDFISKPYVYQDLERVIQLYR
ncbi:response regulator [Cyclobacteriaceae bacterium]|nr:response regulator [Cyclobacteriaceae bacterium]